MRLAWLALLMLIAAVADHAAPATWWWLPQCSLGLAGWALVDGDDHGVPWRGLVVGLTRELADPGSAGFQLLAGIGCALATIAARRWLFRRRASAWMGWTAVLTLMVMGADALVGGAGWLTLPRLLVVTATTALTALAWGWLLGGLPRFLRPLPVEGA